MLTDDELKYHVQYAIAQAKRHYAYRMAQKGANREQIEAKIAGKDWITEINVDQIYKDAGLRKKWYLEEMHNREMEKAEKIEKLEKIRQAWNADAYMRLIATHFIAKHGRMEDRHEQQIYFRALCYFMAKDQRLETEMGMSQNRGLLIKGPSGLGKTETLRAVSKNPLHQLHIVSMIEVAETVRETGTYEPPAGGILVLDDVSNEQATVKHYGTDINWFKDFIEITYLKQSKFSQIIITTNANGDDIEKLYGYRVRSRMREMFSVITIKGEDLRK
jgi:DNA replication protein DnaC